MSYSRPRSRAGGWSEALRLVTGYEVDLRRLCDGNAMIEPRTIVARRDDQRGSSLQMQDNAGLPAIERLRRAVSELDRVMAQVRAGCYGLMDVNRLRAAAAHAEQQSRFLSDLTADARLALAQTAVTEHRGEYRDSVTTTVADLHSRISSLNNAHNNHPRTTAALVAGAAEALASFGRNMAETWFDANLLAKAAGFWEGANANLAAYFVASGWGAGGPLTRLMARDPDAADARWRETLAGYTSAGHPGLPEGTPVITADLMDGWPAFGRGLTRNLAQTLEVMDHRADTALSVLDSAYREAAEALHPGYVKGAIVNGRPLVAMAGTTLQSSGRGMDAGRAPAAMRSPAAEHPRGSL